MTTQAQRPTDLDADEYRRALDAPPTVAHVSELTRRGLPIPASQREASRLLTDAIRREARQVVQR